MFYTYDFLFKKIYGKKNAAQSEDHTA